MVSSLSLTSYVTVSILIIYMAKRMGFGERSIIPWLFLSVGVVIVSINHAVNILSDFGYDISSLLFLTQQDIVLMGSTLVFIGFGLVISDKIIETSMLRRRQDEVKKVMTKLKEKYMRREISEHDLRRIYPKLVERLAELEVKLEEKGAKRQTA